MDTLPSPLFQRWIHSDEEDVGDMKVYRPRGYDFPPARGRDGFEIGSDGKFTLYEIAPTDGPHRIVGQWRQIADSTIKVEFDTSKYSSLVLEIMSSNPEVLMVRQPIGQQEDS